MAVTKRNIVDIDLKRASIYRSFMNDSIGEGDARGDVFGVKVLNDGQEVSLVDCSCVGYFIRQDGVTLVVSGTISGNIAYVTLPEAAYAKSGVFTLAIKISGSGISTTMRIVDGTVAETTTGVISDPSSIIPDIDELYSIISDAETAAAEIGKLHVDNTLITGTRYKIVVTKDL